MALQKTTHLPAGVSGNYVRIVAHRWDRLAREASAVLALYVSAEAAASGATPLAAVFAKLRLTGAKFDEYLSPSAMAETPNDVLGQLYTAARAEPIVCDQGASYLADALDV